MNLERSTVLSPIPITKGTKRQYNPALTQLTPFPPIFSKSLTVFFIFILSIYQINTINNHNYNQLDLIKVIIITTMEVHQPIAGQLLCATCNDKFGSSDLYKEHYKSDHHRYNIKRKMVKLPPVSFQQFKSKMQESKNMVKNQFVCNQCRKIFNSANTLNQHVQSKGHNPNAIVEIKEKVIKKPAVFEKNFNRCLFCLHISASFLENQTHMKIQHSFFIPQREYCKNMEGLIEYLQEKIEVGNMCITCQNKKAKDFQSAEAVRMHMISKGHTFMNTDKGYEQYQKWYDFSILFEEKLKEQESIVPGIQFQTVKVYVDEQETKMEGENEQDWEDEEESEDEDNQQDWQDDSAEENGEIIEEEHEEEEIKEKKEESKKSKIKTYHIMKPTVTSNDQLLLPNGKTLGHRKYRRFYKQTIRVPNWFSQQLKMLTNEEHNSTLTTIAERRYLLQAAKTAKLATKSHKREKKNHLLVGMTNNSLMKHFRCQNSL